MSGDIRWEWASFDALDGRAVYAMLRARAEVFVVEQACAYCDPDGNDPVSWHLLGWRGEALAAYLRLLPPGIRYPEHTIGRVITTAPYRGQGVGRALMAESLRRVADTLGDVPLALGAQSRLEPFYGDFGFVRSGPDFMEDGIAHVPMRRPASASTEPT